MSAPDLADTYDRIADVCPKLGFGHGLGYVDARDTRSRASVCERRRAARG